MKLTKRTLLYSIILTVATASFILFYLLFLMPSLYLNNMKETNYQVSKSFMEDIIREDSLKDITFPSKFSTYVLEIPNVGNTLTISNDISSFDLTLKNEKLMALMDKIRSIDINNSNANSSLKQEDFSNFWEELLKSVSNENFKVSKPLDSNEIMELSTSEIKFHSGKNYVLIENSIMENKNLYTTFFGIAKKEGKTYFSMMPYSVSRIDDIKNIAIGSLPMILTVLSLLTLVFTYIYSKQIVKPIVSLSNHTSMLSKKDLMEKTPFKRKENDEIGELAKDIDTLYEELRLSMNSLKEEMEARELFLKAGSHQLKTPVAASLLLIEGMMANVGRYKERDKYLPEVKNKLIEMQKIIEDLLSLNKSISKEDKEDIKVNYLVEEILGREALRIKEKGMKVKVEVNYTFKVASESLLKKIFENIISNCIDHGSKGSEIIISDTKKGVKIKNTNAQIDEEILGSVFQPFVTSRQTKKSSGLGLYIARKFATDLELEMKIENEDNDVVTYVEDR